MEKFSSRTSMFLNSLPQVADPCLKNTGVPASLHSSMIASAHSGFIFLAFGPDSPPTTTQSILGRSGGHVFHRRGPSIPTGTSERTTGDNRGSIDNHRRLAGVEIKRGILSSAASWFSTVTPSHMFFLGVKPRCSRPVMYSFILAGRFVKIWKT